MDYSPPESSVHGILQVWTKLRIEAYLAASLFYHDLFSLFENKWSSELGTWYPQQSYDKEDRKNKKEGIKHWNSSKVMEEYLFLVPLSPDCRLPWWQLVKNLPAMQETWVRSLDWEDSLEKGIATHSSILAWRIPWTKSMGSQRVGHDWETLVFTSYLTIATFYVYKCHSENKHLCVLKIKVFSSYIF